LRIVGGKYKGRVLVEFKGEDIRPTSDMARECLFNILQYKIIGARFLDLFSGTGAMGIEALSRGAKSVTFNDAAKTSLAVLKKNLDKLKVDEPYSVKNCDAVFLLKSSPEKFDIIYVDPPYKTDLGVKALEVASLALTDDGIVVFEDEKPFNGEIKGLIKYDQRKYGRVHLTFFKNQKNEEE